MRTDAAVGSKRRLPLGLYWWLNRLPGETPMVHDYAQLIPAQDCVPSRILESRAEQSPDHPFLKTRDRTYTYRDLNGSANQVAHGLRALGLQAGERVAVLMQSSPRYLDVWFAIAKAGGVEVPINIAYKGEMLRHILDSAGVAVVIFDAEFQSVVDAIRGDATTVQHWVINEPDGKRATGDDALSLDAITSGEVANLDAPPGYTDLACIMFTSGTTGPSKGVMINHHLLWSYGVNYAEIVGITVDDVSYNYLPFFHVAGKFVLMASMLVNATMILVPRLSISEFWHDVRRYRATLMVAVGGVCHMLFAETPRADDADNTLRLIYAVPAPSEFQQDFEARFALRFVEGYGSTEMNIVAGSTPGETPLGSFGRALGSYELDIFDEHDRPCSPGVAGEIVVRPKRPYTVMQGYFGLPGKSVEVMRNLWLHSGDQGYRDENGWFFFLDRLTDSMRRRGENISSFEVERLVNQHPAIAESAAVAVRSELQEDEVKVVAVRTPGANLTELALLRYCVDTMPYFMVPRFIEFKDALPRTALTKVRKVALRAEGVSEDCWDCEEQGWRITKDGLQHRD
ncbi:MAG: AMP-binding protein [Pseudomonadota bacterium]